MTGLARLCLAHAGLLALASCNKQQATAGFIGAELNKVISADTTSLAGVDLDKLKTTEFYRAREQRIEAVNGLFGQFGLDPQRDFSKVLLMSTGKEAVSVIQGRFPKAFSENGFPTSGKELAGHKIFAFGSDALSFPKPDIALFGPEQTLRHVLEGYEAGATGVPAEFRHSFEQLSQWEAIWCVSRGQLPFAGLARRTDIVSILSNFAGYIESAAAGIFIDSNIHLKGQIYCLSAEGAKRVDDGLRGGIGIARLALRDRHKDLLQLYNSVRVQKENRTVFIQLDLDGALADKLLSRLPSTNGHAP